MLRRSLDPMSVSSSLATTFGRPPTAVLSIDCTFPKMFVMVVGIDERATDSSSFDDGGGRLRRRLLSDDFVRRSILRRIVR